jgi:hypothetical protein
MENLELGTGNSEPGMGRRKVSSSELEDMLSEIRKTAGVDAPVYVVGKDGGERPFTLATFRVVANRVLLYSSGTDTDGLEGLEK